MISDREMGKIEGLQLAAEICRKRAGGRPCKDSDLIMRHCTTYALLLGLRDAPVVEISSECYPLPANE